MPDLDVPLTAPNVSPGGGPLGKAIHWDKTDDYRLSYLRSPS